MLSSRKSTDDESTVPRDAGAGADAETVSPPPVGTEQAEKLKSKSSISAEYTKTR
ncbi:hypothetical protein L21SP2_0790 [Salinispira pacifica]|uniref:Uncharacterized protein n=1 Tax=Salinispira pacifica TaxID=1307761 RepID=V5WEH3_9SPIO|nr:hypothetical protein L21SP2_0790 [Salinispira pacifica]